ncbi:uncharacterized protein LOC110712961 [Chenopodium quinoa]|uniref:uncharacterized protein LOC110712961 n=1 Tax=Chenopodium quinoa TaxID=63459 RepID=UPI000B77AD66|nr:uncharacterized protein LOC110712961 [Chenopodium quinoa]
MASRGGVCGRKPFVQGSRETIAKTHAWLNDMETYWEGMFFKFVFSKEYYDQGIINVPLGFAKAHFGLFPKSTDVVVQLYDTRFDAQLKINRRDEKLIQCLIKNGVDAAIDYYEIQIDEGANISYFHGNPIVFDVTLQLSADS